MKSGGVGGKWEEEEEDEGGETAGLVRRWREEREGERWSVISNFLFLKVGPTFTKIILIKSSRVF